MNFYLVRIDDRRPQSSSLPLNISFCGSDYNTKALLLTLPATPRNIDMNHITVNVNISLDTSQIDLKDLQEDELFKALSTPPSTPLDRVPDLSIDHKICESEPRRQMPVFSNTSLSERWRPKGSRESSYDEDDPPPSVQGPPFNPQNSHFYPLTCSSRFFTECPPHPQIEPVNQITVPLGQENAFFNRLCDTLDASIREFKTHMPD